MADHAAPTVPAEEPAVAAEVQQEAIRLLEDREDLRERDRGREEGLPTPGGAGGRVDPKPDREGLRLYCRPYQDHRPQCLPVLVPNASLVLLQ